MVQLDSISATKKDVSYAATSQSGVKWPQFLAGSLASGGALCSGAILGWAMMQYDSYFISFNRSTEWSATEESDFLILSMLTLGTLHGALPAGYLADIVGRKLVLLFMGGIFWLAGILHVFSSSMEWLLYTSHFLSGFATGCISVIVPLYNEEIAEVTVRGKLGVLYEMNFCCGVLLSYLRLVIFPNLDFPILHFLLPFLFFVTFLWIPESPMYFIIRREEERAKQSLQWLRTSRSHPLYDISAEIHSISTFIENTRFKKLSRYYVEDPDNSLCCGNRKGSNILIVCIIMLVRPICGAYALISYRNTFFQVSGLSGYTISILVISFMLLSNIASQYFVERAGRRILIILSLAGTTVCQVLFAQYFYLRDYGYDVTNWAWLCLILFLVYIILFGIGLGPISWLIMVETLPAESKRWSTGLAASINWLMIFFVTSAFYGFISSIGNTGTFGILFFLNILAISFAALFLPETKNCTREEIQ